MPLPYENATSGTKAFEQIEKVLRKFGCSNFGTMRDWDRGVLICQFTWNKRQVHIEAKGEMAVPSILRDWIKGQVTAIEIGLMPFEHAFMPHMLAADGRPLIEHAMLLLDGPAKAAEAGR